MVRGFIIPCAVDAFWTLFLAGGLDIECSYELNITWLEDIISITKTTPPYNVLVRVLHSPSKGNGEGGREGGRERGREYT